MTDRYDIVVYGKPQPAGSKRHVGHGRIVDANPLTKSWQQEIATEGLRVRNGRGPLQGPLELRVDFYLPRPRSHYHTGKNAGRLKVNAPDQPTSRPDTTKLVRAVEDALTGVWYADDAQLVEQVARKFYSTTPRAMISVARLPFHRAEPIR